jgi:OHCU decarboxylase
MDEQLSLIMAHPDLVGHATAVTLTPDSQQEQTAAGLGNLTPREIAEFQRLNAEYRERFGFPFIICARENRKAAILAAFPVRLTHSRDTEVSAALAEIDKIAWLRLLDRVRGPVE